MSYTNMMWIADGILFALIVIAFVGYIAFVRWKNRRDR